MTMLSPATDLDQRFSSEGASARDWEEARRALVEAGTYWLSTVRPDGRPHVTPLIGLFLDDDAFYFCTGPDERKALNIAANPRVAVTTGCNTLDKGFDVVIESDAVRITADDALRRIAEAYESKYGEAWRFTVRNGAFYHGKGSIRETDVGDAWVFRVFPNKAFGFGKGEPFSQTRWRF